MAKQSVKTFLSKMMIAEIVFLMLSFILFYLLFFNIAINQQFLYPANYGQTLAQEMMTEFKSGKTDFSEVSDIVNYARLDKDNQVIESTISNTKKIKEIVDYPARFQSGRKQSHYVEGDSENLIVSYQLISEFQNPWLRQHLPPAEFIFLGLFLLVLLGGVVLIVFRFSNTITHELDKVIEMSQSILAEDLTHRRQMSRLKEVQDILTSMYKMEDALKNSLEQEWQQQRQAVINLQALTHDIKTPVALISGNLELINETQVTDEQANYLKYAKKGIVRIDQYINELRELSEAPNKEGTTVPFDNQLIQELIDLVIQHTLFKNISCQIVSKKKCPQLRLNKKEFFKAFQNIIENSVRYAPENSLLYLSFENQDSTFRLSVTDQGPGFSQKSLLHGKEQFFTENQRRDGHSGMGLAIADKIVRQEGGQLILENVASGSNITGGRVIIEWSESNSEF